MFLAVTFFVKFILFHIKLTLSRSIVLPDLGGLGLIKEAGTSLNSSRAEATAAIAVNNIAISAA
ncbi:hypothetical protein SDC9_131344 [bioreactor metagenome]|uniref:Uncharacterized protein n=1 Tax=bioreactor metagenome TaxID=1076179 RepID=A0A645D5M9_9ZZZZ